MSGFRITFITLLTITHILLTAGKKQEDILIETVCTLPVNYGKPCPPTSAKTAFYFDPVTGNCTVFKYEGCDKNDNNFDTSGRCNEDCKNTWFRRKERLSDDMVNKRVKADCELPSIAGNCKALIPMWFFNKNKCEEFKWGGCENPGNLNRFNSEQECLGFCKS